MLPDIATGYLSEHYAASFAEWGRPVLLPKAGTWVLERTIRDSISSDVMGLYPLLLCRDWSSLNADLTEQGTNWVSLTAVTDPFAGQSLAELQHTFPDLARPWKEHFVADLGRRWPTFVSDHHARNIRKGQAAVTVNFELPTAELLEKWIALYTQLTARHSIRGLTAFSPTAFAGQFQVPGLSIQTARIQHEVVGMVLWYSFANRVYYHLGAYNEQGYAAHASYALFAAAIEYFSHCGLNWLVLGAGAGTSITAEDGLTRFKRGWSTETRPTFLCGRILDRERYTQLCQQRGTESSAYFPAYRVGEFQ